MVSTMVACSTMVETSYLTRPPSNNPLQQTGVHSALRASLNARS